MSAGRPYRVTGYIQYGLRQSGKFIKRKTALKRETVGGSREFSGTPETRLRLPDDIAFWASLPGQATIFLSLSLENPLELSDPGIRMKFHRDYPGVRGH